ncbi:MAG: tetratricopeptide repeat protein [Alphaproteobacteria bacterium]
MPALLLAGTFGAAHAGEFKSYRKPDPQRFSQGVAAYDAGNYAEAYDIWLPLARHGDLAAVFNIGLMLRDGRGIPQDQPRALAFFKQCAERNHLGCQVNLADMYYTGKGTTPDYKRAASWLMVAARRGHYPSMYQLGGMFERGEGIELNLAAARVLYLAAYEGGYQLAGNRLSELASQSNATAQANPAAPPASPPLVSLRGTLGLDEPEIDDSPEASWNLRASFAPTPSPRPQSDGGPPIPQLRPRVCLDEPKAFDAHPSMCRMRPVRN